MHSLFSTITNQNTVHALNMLKYFVITLDDTSSLQKRLGSTEANLNLSLNGAIIEQVKSSKLLGIHIEQDLDFDAQSDAYVNHYQRKLDFSSTLVHTSKDHINSSTMMLYLNHISFMDRVSGHP